MADWPSDPPRRETFAQDAMTHLRQSQAAKLIPRYPFEGIFTPDSPSAKAMPVVWAKVFPAIPNLPERVNACAKDETGAGWRTLLAVLWAKLSEVDRASALLFERGGSDYRFLESTTLLLGAWLGVNA